MTRLILASTSPARLATLRAAGLSPIPIPSDVDEDAVVADASAARGRPLSIAETVALLARAKAEAVAAPLFDSADAADPRQTDGTIVFGGDSMFEFQGEVWGKPHTPDRARERIRRMSGHSGVLHSGHWLIDRRADAKASGRGVGAVDSATVHFAAIDDSEIDAYVATGEPLEVAGSFTVDGLGAAFIDRVDGAPSCVVGLSVPTLRLLVRRLGIDWTSLWSPPEKDPDRGAR